MLNQSDRIFECEKKYTQLPECVCTKENWVSWLGDLSEVEMDKFMTEPKWFIFRNMSLYHRYVLESKGIIMDEFMKTHLSGDDYAVWREQDRSSKLNDLHQSTLPVMNMSAKNPYENADLLLFEIKSMCFAIQKIAEEKESCIPSDGDGVVWGLFLWEYSDCIEKIKGLNYYLEDAMYPAFRFNMTAIDYNTLDFKFFVRRFTSLYLKIVKLESCVQRINNELHLEPGHEFCIWCKKIIAIKNKLKNAKPRLELYAM